MAQMPAHHETRAAEPMKGGLPVLQCPLHLTKGNQSSEPQSCQAHLKWSRCPPSICCCRRRMGSGSGVRALLLGRSLSLCLQGKG